MDYNTVLEATLNNGGYSENTNNRYMVADSLHETIIPIQDLTSDTIKEYHNRIINKGLTLGTWINENSCYLDASYGFNDKDQALSFARLHGQLAIYDTELCKSIYL